MNQESEYSANIKGLKKRADELNCLYRIMEILKDPGGTLKDKCSAIIRNIPSGLPDPERTHIKITLNSETYYSENFVESHLSYSFPIQHNNAEVGQISIYGTADEDYAEERKFGEVEARLIRTIAGHMENYLTDSLFDSSGNPDEWLVLFEMLKNTNRELYYRICRKLLNVLNWEGHEEADNVLKSINRDLNYHRTRYNRFRQDPSWGAQTYIPDDFDRRLVKLVQTYLSGIVVLKLIQTWIQEEKLGLLAQVGNRNLSIDEMAHSIRRYIDTTAIDLREYSPIKWGIQISLIRKFLSEQIEYIDIAKNILDIRDFHRLLNNLIYSKESRGKLGSKAAVTFLLDQIVRKQKLENEKFRNIKTPKTWYISSDIIYHFMGYNDFEDVIEQKYKDPSQIRLEYPSIVQSFKNGQFPEDIIKELSAILDDFGEVPLIVRSSSLLEDQIGSAFRGKYQSLFLSNRGSKSERLTALMNAVAEVYASIFSPEPLEYRSKAHLLDCYEEMGIMIQQVVGNTYGKYFLPLFSGVASSENEYPWSPQVKRKDGLLCMAPGLWALRHSRLKDDYPILFPLELTAGEISVQAGDIGQFLPQNICVLNLETNGLETISITEFLLNVGPDCPELAQIILPSESADNEGPSNEEGGSDRNYITLKGLLENTSLITQLRAVLECFGQVYSKPVSVEFASQGDDIYIINCRAYNLTNKSAPAPIPKDLPREQVLFSVGQNTVNGLVESISHIVYIDPAQYVDQPDLPIKKQIGPIIGRLNRLLPKKRFILLGPWKWSRSKSLHHGVEIDFGDIDASAAVIDIPLRNVPYIPECLRETHLFQDLLKAGVHYLTCLPDNNDDYINRNFLRDSANIITDIIPDIEKLSHIVKLIDISQNTGGRALRLTMNADLNEAMAYFTTLPAESEETGPVVEKTRQKQDSYWRWRLRMAEHIASELNAARFGVKNFYVFGSTKNATAGPCSDIDIIIHFGGTQDQLRQLKLWFEGWSLCLDEMNYLRTGYRTQGLLDVQYITDEDIINKSCFASMIGAITDPARPLKLKQASR